MLKLPDGTMKVLVEGQQRARIEQVQEGEHFSATVLPLPPEAAPEDTETEALRRAVT